MMTDLVARIRSRRSNLCPGLNPSHSIHHLELLRCVVPEGGKGFAANFFERDALLRDPSDPVVEPACAGRLMYARAHADTRTTS